MKPILFSGPMVRAILAGKKTQTRRICNGKDDWVADKAVFGFTIVTPPGHISMRGYGDEGYGEWFIRCPHGQPGDRLWVRETWAPAFNHGAWGTLFAADGSYQQGKRKHERGPYYNASDLPPVKWRPSIFMPRWASRIMLEIVSVRVERLQDISEADAREEGISCPEHGGKPGPSCSATCASFASEFACLWDSINAKRAPWASNPWVWAISFRRVAQEARAA